MKTIFVIFNLAVAAWIFVILIQELRDQRRFRREMDEAYRRYLKTAEDRRLLNEREEREKKGVH